MCSVTFPIVGLWVWDYKDNHLIGLHDNEVILTDALRLYTTQHDLKDQAPTEYATDATCSKYCTHAQMYKQAQNMYITHVQMYSPSFQTNHTTEIFKEA